MKLRSSLWFAGREELAFQNALKNIPRGSVKSYGAVANSLGTAPRAVASRCASNRLLLRIPCHRVVAKQSIGGYQLGNAWKTLLLDLERHLERRELDTF